MHLLDTNVISEIRKPSADTNVVAWFREQEPTALFLSAITMFELDLGVRRLERRDPLQGAALRRWLDGAVRQSFRGRVLAVDELVARRAAALQVPDPRPDRDCFIAATALTHGLRVVTRNTRDFQHLEVELVNPWDA